MRTIGVDRRQVIVQQARLACKVRISSKELALVTPSTATRPCAAYKAVLFDWTAALALVNQQFADRKEIVFAVRTAQQVPNNRISAALTNPVEDFRPVGVEQQ